MKFLLILIYKNFKLIIYYLSYYTNNNQPMYTIILQRKKEWLIITKIFLKKHETMYIETNIYIINQGSIVLKQIFEDGQLFTIPKYFIEGDIIGNFFYLDSKIDVLSYYIEIFALNNVILEEVLNIKLVKESIYQKIISHLLNIIAIEISRNLKNKKEFLLDILRKLSIVDEITQKKLINPSIVNFSKSQYYLLITQLKKEKKIQEKNNIFKRKYEIE